MKSAVARVTGPPADAQESPREMPSGSVDVARDARTFLQDLDLYRVPVSPQEICRRLDVLYDEKPYQNIDGVLLVSKTQALIGVSSRMNSARRSFTCAHELGHYFYDLESQDSFLCRRVGIVDSRPMRTHKKTSKDLKEVRANDFAKELLLPEEFVRDRVQGQRPSWKLIESLAKDFGCSLQAAAYRYVELAEEKCSILWVRKNRPAHSFGPLTQGLFPRTKKPVHIPRCRANWIPSLLTHWFLGLDSRRRERIFYSPRPFHETGSAFFLFWSPASPRLLL